MTKKISQLPAATSVDTNDEFVINQDGTTKKLTTANQWDFANVNIDGGTIDGTAVNATNLAYTGTLTGGTGVVNLGSGQVFKDANGNVGVGTTSPSAKLDVVGASGTNNLMARFSASTSNQTVEVARTGTSLSYASLSAIANISYLTGGPNLGVRIANNDGSSASDVIRINASGNVGIGTTSPTTSLTVGANPVASISSSELLQLGKTSDAFMSVFDGTGRGVFGSTSGVPFVGSFSNTAFEIRTNNIERIRVDSLGRVGVGVAPIPGVQLVVQGGGGHAVFGETTTTTSANATFLCRNNGASGTRGLIEFRNAVNNTVGNISHNGTSTTYGTSSDYRLKENIQPLTGALDKVQAMNPVTYDWKAGGEGEGFIAHELQNIAPYAVSGGKDGEDMQGVDYGKLTTLLVGAVKELTAKVEQLEAQLGANNGN